MAQTTELDIDLQKSDLMEEQKQNLLTFIKDNRKVFASHLSELGSTDVYKHTVDETPVTSRHYMMSQ